MDKVGIVNTKLDSRNINVDILRILAASMVLFVHIGAKARINFLAGAYGVQLFFILSGYLGMAYFGGGAKSYYKKRICRILPAYYFGLGILYLKELFINLYASIPLKTIFTESVCSIRFLRYVFCLQVVFPTDNWYMWGNRSALWSMSSFAFFYLMLPLYYRLFNTFRKILGVVLTLLFLNPMIANLIEENLSGYPEDACISYFADKNPITTAYCFLMGVSIYLMIKERKYKFIFAIFIVLLVTKFSWYPFELLFMIMVSVMVCSPQWTKDDKARQIISFLSKGSFLLYLIHPIILSFLPNLQWKESKVLKMGYMLFLALLTVGVSYVMYYCIVEKMEKYIRNRLIKD